MEIKVLDHGFVRVVDRMGDDSSIVQAARVSYGKGTKTSREDAGLINYLMRNDHTSPFEMCEIKFHIKLPIFVARQWIRHRTANINECSGRYSEMPDEFYVPELENISLQSKNNKQGRAEALPADEAIKFQSMIREVSNNCYRAYEDMLKAGVARELARTVLPINVYTQWYWKIDLHNLLRFLRLRIDMHAQWEIRQYAEAIATVVKDWMPMTWDAFIKHGTKTANILQST